jgi:hypothetical protein
MIEKRTSRPLLPLALLFALVVIVELVDAATARAHPRGESPAAANEFLDRFIGEWVGEGTAGDTPISEELLCERVLARTFLLMLDREIGGGNFKADIYVGYSVEGKRYELYTFNNNTALGSSLPVRGMKGHRVGETLVMQEKPGPAGPAVHVRIPGSGYVLAHEVVRRGAPRAALRYRNLPPAAVKRTSQGNRR